MKRRKPVSESWYNKFCIYLLEMLRYNIPDHKRRVHFGWHIFLFIPCLVIFILTLILTTNIQEWVFLLYISILVFKCFIFFIEHNNYNKFYYNNFTTAKRPPFSPYAFKTLFSGIMIVFIAIITLICYTPAVDITGEKFYSLITYFVIVINFIDDLFKSLVVLYDAQFVV